MRVFFGLLIGFLFGYNVRLPKDSQLTYEVLSVVNVVNALEVKLGRCDKSYKPTKWAVDGTQAYMVKP
jgi:hypothetical protein